jgi:carbamoyl-phosphate synthase large subunit
MFYLKIKTFRLPEKDLFMRQRSSLKAKLYFYNHQQQLQSFSGFFCGMASELQKGIWGEAAFTTAQTGYGESITDPSYYKQHLIFATPHLGNYPLDQKSLQSDRSHLSSIISPSFTSSAQSWSQFAVPRFECEETRTLIHQLVQGLLQPLSVYYPWESSPPSYEDFLKQKEIDQGATLVGTQVPIVVKEGQHPLVLIDYGVKKAIVTQLQQLPYPLVILPAHSTFETILSYHPSLLFLSNGPGNPALYPSLIKTIQRVILETTLPIRGICLGHQLLALALGMETIKLPYGHRGTNHPVFDHQHNRSFQTSQNHGYAVSESSFEKQKYHYQSLFQLEKTHTSLFDGSLEGFMTTDNRIKSVQFHPEASPGPTDVHFFFQDILCENRDPITIHPFPKNYFVASQVQKRDPQERPFSFQKVLLIGPGPIKIGQAAEFDYSGTQALKALKNVGLDVVLVNSNPATIMTDPALADQTYLSPLTAESLTQIIKKEKVQAVLSSFGGQTALNLALQLEKEGLFQQEGIQLLGPSAWTIEQIEDRELFAQKVTDCGFTINKKKVFFDEEQLHQHLSSDLEPIIFPQLVRQSFALGGQGARIFRSPQDVVDYLQLKPPFPLIFEQSLLGYKEIELEVMRDKAGHKIIVCSIENIDPCGIHTGDSITVAPALTLSDRCFQRCRDICFRLCDEFQLIGGANIQYAINPDNDEDIYVIEMNPRVSRSSALASKATGYPIAKISALLSLGYLLPEIPHDMTLKTSVFFEPMLDYVAVKIPLFPFSKFPYSSRVLGPQMKSVGEVLAMAPTFTEAFLKALRSLECGLEIPRLSQLPYHHHHFPHLSEKESLFKCLEEGYELSLLIVLEALRLGLTLEQIAQKTAIHPWFLEQTQSIYLLEKEIESTQIVQLSDQDKVSQLIQWKKMGFTDLHLSQLLKTSEWFIYSLRKEWSLRPHYRGVDTCAGEFEAQTPYFYGTYLGIKDHQLKPLKSQQSYLVLGSGPNRIGQGIEFDYACVKVTEYLKKNNALSVFINSNPETVSTDYDCSDRLFISPLYREDVDAIYDFEQPQGIIHQFSGQTGLLLRKSFEDFFHHHFPQSFPFLGTSQQSTYICEDREQFAQFLQQFPLQHTKSLSVSSSRHEVEKACEQLGYPVIVRPSFVIGGERMIILKNDQDRDRLSFSQYTDNDFFHIEHFIADAREYDVDAIRDKNGQMILTIAEHIELAGIHSGDSGMIYPAQQLSPELKNKMTTICQMMAEALHIIGPINFQFAIKDDELYCLEANPRGSRTIPFLSKATQLDKIELNMQAILKESMTIDLKKSSSPSPFIFVKQATFAFDRFPEDEQLLGPKMKSTGETIGLALHLEQALYESYLANYQHFKKTGKIIVSISDKNKQMILPKLKMLTDKGFKLVATPGTYHQLVLLGIDVSQTKKIQSHHSHEDISTLFFDSELMMVFTTPEEEIELPHHHQNGFFLRKLSYLYKIPCFTCCESICAVIESLTHRPSPLSLQTHSLQDISS